MKTILIPTDFSENANHAAEYGYHLARQIKADVILCNAMIIPAEVPQAGVMIWPMEEYNVLMEDSRQELKHLKKHLEKTGEDEGLKPEINCIHEAGIVGDVINSVISQNKIDLVVIGTHGSKGISQFILGDHSHDMINSTGKPLLIVPPGADFKPIKKIAFATDLAQLDNNLKAIYALISLAKMLNAEILLTHVFNEKSNSSKLQKWFTDLLTELSNNADYPYIYYRQIKNSNPEAGLDWLCEHGQIDMLAMLHRPHGFFDNIMKGSHTQKMASHIGIPLLVFPAGA
jgi:nucleotide-binding universal stress UspA family protein